jgi:phospholipase C
LSPSIPSPPDPDGLLSRRTLLRGAAGGAALLAASGLPAWARPVASAAGLRRPDSLPFPNRPAGTPSIPQVEHIVVLIMENHSFDNLLGMVPYELPAGAAADGLTRRRGRFTNVNFDPTGHKVFAERAVSPCQLQHVPRQSWNASHQSWGGGRNDGFVKASSPMAMRFWDQRDLPFTYSMVEHFPIGDRFFSSSLSQTYPNRRFFFTGTASGTIATDATTFTTPAANGTIFDRLDDHRINWRIYYQDVPSWLIVPGVATPARAGRAKTFDQFLTDTAAGKLAQFTFLDPQYGTTSEENPQDIQVGERYIAQVVNALMHAPTWKRTALFITYDEHGGYYDPATRRGATTATASACR